MAEGKAAPTLITALLVGFLCRSFQSSFVQEFNPEKNKTNVKNDLVLQLSTLQIFMPGSAVNVKIGVPENYDGIFPWYLSKVRFVLRFSAYNL